MYLETLEAIPKDISAIIIFCPSEQMNVFIKDTVYKTIKGNKEYCQTLKTAKDLKNAMVKSSLAPFGTSSWLFDMNLDNSDGLTKDIKRNITNNVAGLYVFYTSKYFTYKNIKNELKDYKIMDFYIGYLVKKDVIYIYDRKVSKENRVSSQMLDFLVENYSNDIDAIFKFFSFIESGDVIKDTKDIVNICGMGGNTVPKFALGLLQSKINSEINAIDKKEQLEENRDKGRKRIISNKLKLATELEEVYNWRYIYKATLSTIEALCNLKMLYINGSLYKRNLNMEDAKGFDDVTIARGMKFWYRIHELPLRELINLRAKLEEKVWESELEFSLFLYNYYE